MDGQDASRNDVVNRALSRERRRASAPHDAAVYAALRARGAEPYPDLPSSEWAAANAAAVQQVMD